jgi:hypothetical protein
MPQQVDINISGKDRIGSIFNLWNASWDLIAKTIGYLSLRSWVQNSLYTGRTSLTLQVQQGFFAHVQQPNNPTICEL